MKSKTCGGPVFTELCMALFLEDEKIKVNYKYKIKNMVLKFTIIYFPILQSIEYPKYVVKNQGNSNCKSTNSKI